MDASMKSYPRHRGRWETMLISSSESFHHLLTFTDWGSSVEVEVIRDSGNFHLTACYLQENK